MSLSSLPQGASMADLPSRTITVTVVDAKIPPSTAKSTNQVTYIVSYQYYDTIDVDETPAFENSRDVPISFSKTFELKQSEEFCESLVRRPLRFTLYEVIPAGRTLIGVAEVAMDAFVSTSQTESSDWYPVKLEEGLTLIDIPSIQVNIKLSEPLLTDEQRAQINILSINLDAMYSLPSRWAIKDGQDLASHPFIYAARILVPQTEESDVQFYFSRGTLTKSPADTSVQSNTEQGGLSEQEQNWFKAETCGDRIIWNVTHKVFISSALSKSFMQLIETKPFTLELRRLLVDPSEPDPNAKKYQASSQFLVSGLLSPGVSSISVRSPIVTYTGSEPADSPFDNRILSPKSQEKGAKQAADKSKAAKKPVKKKRPELDPEEDESVNPYEAAGSYLLFNISTMRPFVQLTKKRRNTLKPTDLIPSRGSYGPLPPAKSATDEFQKILQDTSETLAKDFYSLFSTNFTQACEDPSVKDRFLYELNSSGKYLVFKEKVRRAVISVVRERFNKKPNSTKRDFEDFHNKLYVYLMEQVHQTLNQMMPKATKPVESEIFAAENTLSSQASKLRQLAYEAELDNNLIFASKLHLERVAQNQNDASTWFEYGQYLLRSNDKMKAEEVIRESIARDGKYVPALLSYGASLLGRTHLEQAHIYLREAATIEPSNPCIWLILTVLFEKMDAAEDLCNAQDSLSKILAEEQRKEPNSPSIYLRTARLLLSFSNTALLEPILAQEIAISGRSPETCILSGKMFALKEDFVKAEEMFQEAISLSPDAIDASIEIGHMHFKQQRFQEALTAYEGVLRIDPKCQNLELLTRLAKIYSIQGQYDDSKELYLACCQISPSSLSWLGAGLALYRMGLYEDAEVALSEANIYDNRNPDTWCLLALLGLRCDFDSEADRCMRQALRFNPSNPNLLR
eukprot:TRINITY_DN7565_c0_g1_i5.p1 TRINITY_DN7565_c0_g1~~TRINITY_DN7565_c0_g1_i5.p1  ORF type:complete len:912 (+),score=191.50 TRINITY_DN7565_c0_g1_i5:128-2863(+)